MTAGSTTVEKIKKGIDRLPENAREELYSYLKYLEYRESSQKKTVGAWSELGGSISREEAEELKGIIKEGCENIDRHEW